jgi:hypothetical protein
MRCHSRQSSVKRDMYEPSYPTLARPADRRPSELERARRRRDQAAQGSPDWDAASEAVMELEAADALVRAEPPHRRLFLLEPSSAR